ncbi:MAG: biotin/lipoyl-binding protein [Candidatus Symbiothrix sp.]|jgi:HlyD family secretion protein|nr:biotin/lipoyl-binding protein [Candidatus Symbiothrix sp.]
MPVLHQEQRSCDTIIADISELTGSVPPAAIAARASGKLKELYVNDNQEVKAGDYLAVIDNPANTQDIQKLKTSLENPDPQATATLPLAFRRGGRGVRLGTLQSLYSTFYKTLSDYQKYRKIHITTISPAPPDPPDARPDLAPIHVRF